LPRTEHLILAQKCRKMGSFCYILTSFFLLLFAVVQGHTSDEPDTRPCRTEARAYEDICRPQYATGNWVRFVIIYFSSIRSNSHFAKIGCLLRIGVGRSLLQGIGSVYEYLMWCKIERNPQPAQADGRPSQDNWIDFDP